MPTDMHPEDERSAAHPAASPAPTPEREDLEEQGETGRPVGGVHEMHNEHLEK